MINIMCAHQVSLRNHSPMKHAEIVKKGGSCQPDASKQYVLTMKSKPTRIY